MKRVLKAVLSTKRVTSRFGGGGNRNRNTYVVAVIVKDFPPRSFIELLLLCCSGAMAAELLLTILFAFHFHFLNDDLFRMHCVDGCNERQQAPSQPWSNNKRRRRRERTGSNQSDMMEFLRRLGRILSPSSCAVVLLVFVYVGTCHSLLGSRIGPFATTTTTTTTARSRRHGYYFHPTTTTSGLAALGDSNAGAASPGASFTRPRGRPRKASAQTRTSLSAASTKNSRTGGGAAIVNNRRQLRMKKTNNNKKMRSTSTTATTTTTAKTGRVPKQHQQQTNDTASFVGKVGSYFIDQGLLGHDLLSREEEQKFGRAVQRATRIREALETIMEEEEELLEKEQQQQEQQFTERNVEENDLLLMKRRRQGGRHIDITVEDEDGLGDDLTQLSIYGMDPDIDDANDRRDIRDWLTQQESNRRNREEEDSLFISMAAGSMAGSSGSSSIDDSESAADYFDNRIRTTVPLDDDEILASLGLEGGRDTLRQVLLDGSVARDALIRGNIRLVLSIAKRWCKQYARGTAGSMSSVYAGSWDRPSLDEAVQEGIVGLAKAVDRFDPDRKFRFSTYATWWVTNSVRQCFQKASTGCVRLPALMYETKRKYKRLVKGYYDRGKPVPDLDVLAAELDVGLSRLELILRVTRPLVSIDNPMSRGTYSAPGKAGSGVSEDAFVLTDTLVDSELTPEERVELSFMRQSLESAMATELAPPDRDILRLRLGLDDGVTRTVRQVAEAFGGAITMAEVRTRERRAYSRLRSPHALSTYSLLGYLDLAGVDKSTVNLS